MTEVEQPAGPAGAPDWGAPRAKTVQWYDPMIAAAAAADSGLSGLEFLRAIRDGKLPAPPIAVLMGFHPVEVGEGYVVFEGTPDESVYNPIGMVHGGYVCTLADTVAACAVHTTLPAGVGYTSIDLNVSYTRRVTRESGTLRAVGSVVKPGRRVAFSRAEILDEAGKVVASATSSCLIMPGADAGALDRAEDESAPVLDQAEGDQGADEHQGRGGERVRAAVDPGRREQAGAQRGRDGQADDGDDRDDGEDREGSDRGPGAQGARGEEDGQDGQVRGGRRPERDEQGGEAARAARLSLRCPPVQHGGPAAVTLVFMVAVAVAACVRVVIVIVVIVRAGSVRVVVRMVAVGAMIMPVPVAFSTQFQDQEDGAGRDQDAADDEVGVTGDGGAELQPDQDHHPADQQGHHDVSDGGGQRQARHPARAVVAGAGQDRQRQPVVGHDRVPEADAGGAEHDDGEGVHALNNTLSYSHQ
jgi:uncharacterized protein (TIGR00369 family)